MARETVQIFWMNGDTAIWTVDSTGLNQGVLNLYGVKTREEYGAGGTPVPDKHIPISNIKYWDKNGVKHE